MEAGYHRSKIQEKNMHQETSKHTGEHPIVSINALRNLHGDPVPESIELASGIDEEKQGQLNRLREPATLGCMQRAVIDSGNLFAELTDPVRCCLGRITNAMFEVGGQCRRGT
jgi:methylmalonyl-CoA mutase